MFANSSPRGCCRTVRLSAVGSAGFVVASMVLVAAPLRAASYSWAVAAGDWSVASNWGGAVPSISETACVANGGTATITTSGLKSNAIDVGGAAGGTIDMTSGSSWEYFATVGLNGSGTFLQSGGTNNDSNKLYLGYNAEDSGVYSLSGSATLSTYYEYVGYAGTGVFNQTGGTNLTQTLSLGNSASAAGTYTMSGNSQLSATLGEFVSYVSGITTGPALFSQTSGLNSAASLYVGSAGTLDLSGGTMQLGGSLINKGVIQGGNTLISVTGNGIIDFSQGLLNQYATDHV